MANVDLSLKAASVRLYTSRVYHAAFVALPVLVSVVLLALGVANVGGAFGTVMLVVVTVAASTALLHSIPVLVGWLDLPEVRVLTFADGELRLFLEAEFEADASDLVGIYASRSWVFGHYMCIVFQRADGYEKTIRTAIAHPALANAISEIDADLKSVAARNNA